MATGSDTYMGLAVPLYGDSIITQRTGATDVLTLEGANGQTGDFLVARDSTETERFVVEDGGNVAIVQKAAGDVGVKITQASGPTANALSVLDNGGAIRFGISPEGRLLNRIYTTRPTTGLVKGETLVLFHGSTPKLGICTSVAAQTIKLIRLKTKTFGRLTA